MVDRGNRQTSRIDRSTAADRHLCPADPRRWLRRALALWLVLVVVVGVKAAINPKKHSVYPLFVAGARHWWADQSLYAEYPDVLNVFEVFRYSPTCALSFSALALLPDRFGAILWNALNLGVLAWGLVLASRDVFPGRWSVNRLAALLGLTLVGAVRPAWNGQSNPLVAGLLLLATSAIARRRGRTAAVLLAATVYLKVSPIAIALLLVAIRPRLLLGRFTVSLLVGAALPFCTKPATSVVGQYLTWFELLRGSTNTRWPAFRDAWTVWELTGSAVHVPSYRILQAVAGLATLVWCLVLQRRSGGSRRVLTGVLAMGSAYLMEFGPSVEHSTYVVLAPCVSWAILHAVERRQGRAWVILVYACTMILGADLVERPLQGALPIVRAFLPVGCALFAAWLVRHPFRGPEEIPEKIAIDLDKPSRHDAAAHLDRSPRQLHPTLIRRSRRDSPKLVPEQVG